MKRAFSFLAVLSLLVPLIAQAEWVDTPLRFKISGMGPAQNATIWVRDTINVRVNGVNTGGPVDTLADFVPKGLGTAGLGAHETAAVPRSDSLLVGWLIFQSDSTAGLMSSLQVLFQGRAGGYENFSPVTLGNYTNIDSLSVTLANGVRSIVVPITQSKLQWPIVRAVLTGGVGNLPSATCIYRHWVPASQSRRD